MEIKMRTRSLLISATLIFVLVLTLASIAFAADPFIGTWKLNVAKSKMEPSQMPKSVTHKNVAQGNGIKTTFDGVDAQGKEFHSESAGVWDGKDFPVKGDPGADRIALKKVDANTVNVVAKKAGKEVGTYRTTITKDGKTMTMIFKGKDDKGQERSYTQVWDRQ
jgi:hypothetical protein